MKERVLITGASGFVGYHLIEEALKNNLEVYAAVRKSSNVAHLKHFNITYTYPDFTDVDALKQEIIGNDYQYIIHAAGVTRAKNLAAYNAINANYTINLATAAATAPGFKKFIFISSLAAMGPLKTLTGIINDDDTPHPISAYGESKLLAEERLKAVAHLNYTVLRPTAVYGPRDTGIYLAFKQFAKGIEAYIGPDRQKLSFIYVKDLAAVSVKALFAGQRKAYNLSDGNFYDRYELADITKNVLDVKTFKFHLSVTFVKFIAAVSEFIGSLRGQTPILNTEKLTELTAVNWFCNIDEARHDLSFYPSYNLEAGVTETITWYKAHNWL